MNEADRAMTLGGAFIFIVEDNDTYNFLNCSLGDMMTILLAFIVLMRKMMAPSLLSKFPRLSTTIVKNNSSETISYVPKK